MSKPESESPCYMELSTDRQWVRVIVDGHRAVAFHSNYVRLILNGPKTLENIHIGKTTVITAEMFLEVSHV